MKVIFLEVEVEVKRIKLRPCPTQAFKHVMVNANFINLNILVCTVLAWSPCVRLLKAQTALACIVTTRYSLLGMPFFQWPALYFSDSNFIFVSMQIVILDTTSM